MSNVLLAVQLFLFVFVCDLRYQINRAWYGLLGIFVLLLFGAEPGRYIAEIVTVIASS